MTTFSRRNFLKTSIIGSVAATCIKPFDTLAAFGKQEQFKAHVALTSGDNRAEVLRLKIRDLPSVVRISRG